MFSAKNKLSKKGDFALIYKKGIIFQSDYLKIFVLPNGLNYNRFSIIAPKTVSTQAVIRNKVKRRLKNILLNIKSNKHTSIDLVIKTFKGIEKLDSSTLKERFEVFFDKLKDNFFILFKGI